MSQESFSLTWTPAAPAGAAPAPPYPGGACCPGAASPPLPPCEAGSGGGRWGEGWSCSRSWTGPETLVKRKIV